MEKNMKLRFGFKHIQSELTFWFLLVALVPVLSVGLITYFDRKEAIQEHEKTKLEAVRDLKVESIGAWFMERSVDLRTFADNIQIRSIEEVFHAKERSAEDQRRMDVVRGLLWRYR